jgi:hypothetical protein
VKGEPSLPGPGAKGRQGEKVKTEYRTREGRVFFPDTT